MKIDTPLEQKFEGKKLGGLEKIPESDSTWYKFTRCNHPEHNPPAHIHIPQGYRYRHICPGCGAERLLQPPQITFKAE